MFHRHNEGAERMRQRKEAEDQAPRLAESCPTLQTLRLQLRFRRGETRIEDSAHVKIVVVPRAPAMFFVPCADKECREGGHDITSMVMDGLRRKQTTVTGEDACHGTLGSAQSRCSGSLEFVATATYG